MFEQEERQPENSPRLNRTPEFHWTRAVVLTEQDSQRAGWSHMVPPPSQSAAFKSQTVVYIRGRSDQQGGELLPCS